MNLQEDAQAAEKLISTYAAILNTADLAAIPSFYANDGVFMPDGYKILTATDLKHARGSYLKTSGFQISYEVQQVIVDGTYAFIEATAHTKRNTKEEKQLTQKSRDFFVLRKEDEEWKIFCYMFNQVKA